MPLPSRVAGAETAVPEEPVSLSVTDPAGIPVVSEVTVPETVYPLPEEGVEVDALILVTVGLELAKTATRFGA